MNEIRKAVRNGDETTVRLLNYRKDGTPFWNMLSIAPINDADGVLRFYIGVQVWWGVPPKLGAAIGMMIWLRQARLLQVCVQPDRVQPKLHGGRC